MKNFLFPKYNVFALKNAVPYSNSVAKIVLKPFINLILKFFKITMIQEVCNHTVLQTFYKCKNFKVLSEQKKWPEKFNYKFKSEYSSVKFFTILCSALQKNNGNLSYNCKLFNLVTPILDRRINLLNHPVKKRFKLMMTRQIYHRRLIQITHDKKKEG